MEGVRLPLLVTTSREPSNRTRSFVNELVATVPVFIRFNRGKTTLQELFDISLSRKARFVLMIYEKKGNPSLMRIYEVEGIQKSLVERYDLLLKGITLYREKHGSKPPRYKGEYCISWSEECGVLGEIISKVTGYHYCVNPDIKSEVSMGRIEVSRSEDLCVISFKYNMKDLGPVIRVRRYEIKG